LLGELQHDAVEADGVVEADDTLLLVTEDLLELAAAQRPGWDRWAGGRIRC